MKAAAAPSTQPVTWLMICAAERKSAALLTATRAAPRPPGIYETQKCVHRLFFVHIHVKDIKHFYLIV